MTRISIKAHHKQYLELIAAQMGTDQITALDYALWELKRQGFSFSSPLSPVVPAPQAIGAFVHYQEVAPTATPVIDSEPDQEPDEIIQKLAALLEEF